MVYSIVLKILMAILTVMIFCRSFFSWNWIAFSNNYSDRIYSHNSSAASFFFFAKDNIAASNNDFFTDGKSNRKWWSYFSSRARNRKKVEWYSVSLFLVPGIFLPNIVLMKSYILIFEIFNIFLNLTFWMILNYH